MTAGDQRATPQCGKTMVTMQVRSLAMLQRRLYSCRPGVATAKQHAVEKTFLEPIQLVALTRPVGKGAKRHPPKGGQPKVPNRGVSESVKHCIIAKRGLLHARPV